MVTLGAGATKASEQKALTTQHNKALQSEGRRWAALLESKGERK